MTWWLFQNLVIRAALAPIVAPICRTTRIGPVARHALWVLVLLKFVTPPLVVWPWAAPDPFRLAAVERVAVVPVPVVSGAVTLVDDASAPVTYSAPPPALDGDGVPFQPSMPAV